MLNKKDLDVLKHLNGYCEGDSVNWTIDKELAISNALEALSTNMRVGKNKQVLTLNIKENCYISISTRENFSLNILESLVTFGYCKNNIFIEVEPLYGPMTAHYKNSKSKFKHYFLGKATCFKYWDIKQLNITKEMVNGNFDKIFKILENHHTVIVNEVKEK